MSDNNNKSEYDNGGAIAIKGFNYQSAIAALIIICNYEKENFSIYLETKDDIEVQCEKNSFFIQAKSEKLTIDKLIKTDKNNKSILSKSLSKSIENSNNYYKIATLEFSKKEQEKLTKKVSEHLFKNRDMYEIKDDIKETLIDALVNQGIEKESVKQKLKNSFIYFTPFTDNAENAYNCLLGFMNECNISIDGGKGKMILNELINLINQKSEKRIKNDKEKDCKKLDSKYLKSLIKTERHLSVNKALADRLEQQQVITFQESVLIKESLLSISLKHLALKNKIKNIIGEIDVESDPTVTIKLLYEKVNRIIPEENKSLLFAIIIDLYIDDLIYSQRNL